MLKQETQLRAERQIKNITRGYKEAKAAGYDVQALSLPAFESQEDHDKYHPDEVGEDFREHNEFASEILKGLHANGVPAELVTIHYADYSQWLKGRPNTSDSRAAYGAYLLTKKHIESAKN
jgi:hypothetical protein